MSGDSRESEFARLLDEVLPPSVKLPKAIIANLYARASSYEKMSAAVRENEKHEHARDMAAKVTHDALEPYMETMGAQLDQVISLLYKYLVDSGGVPPDPFANLLDDPIATIRERILFEGADRLRDELGSGADMTLSRGARANEIIAESYMPTLCASIFHTIVLSHKSFEWTEAIQAELTNEIDGAHSPAHAHEHHLIIVAGRRSAMTRAAGQALLALTSDARPDFRTVRIRSYDWLTQALSRGRSSR